ncbi:hypothetical protein FRC12_013060 [Ceratobasidium sp. 428]|nr:hypothetical protein FRC12_013060 [Ceratobasidium sp. 428]
MSVAGVVQGMSRQYASTDLVSIVVFGCTGVGKSTFVNEASAELRPRDPADIFRLRRLGAEGTGGTVVPPRVPQPSEGRGLASRTQEIQAGPIFQFSGRNIQLYDTPGFDDTMLMDTQILKKFAEFLEEIHRAGREINAVLYLHRVIDRLMTDTSTRSLDLFTKICGLSNMPNAMIVTDTWTNSTIGLFKVPLNNGAKICHREGTGRQSAHAIIQMMIHLPPIKLQLQKELARGLPLDETDAGILVDQNLRRSLRRWRKEMEELEEQLRMIARRDQDRSARDQLEQYRRGREEEGRHLQEQLELLKASRWRMDMSARQPSLGALSSSNNLQNLGSPDLDPQYPCAVNGTAIFLSRGAAADIWLIETPESKYIIKILRLDLEYFSTTQVKNISYEDTSRQDDPTQRFTQYFRSKARSWTMLQHRNVIKVFGIGECLDLRVEFCENGTARKYLEWYNNEIDKKKLLIQHVLEGMHYLHSQNPPIVHGGLRADKIFVTADGTAKIGEFGLSFLARDFALNAPSISQAGLSRWMSPELVDIDPDTGVVVPTTASDVWALACTLLEIMSGEIPYHKYKHELRVRKAIIRGEKPGIVEPGQIRDFPSISYYVSRRCWETSPNNRPSVSHLQQAFQMDVFTLAMTNPKAIIGHHQTVTTHKELSPESRSLPRPDTVAALEGRVSDLQSRIRAQMDELRIFTPEESKDSFPDPDIPGETSAYQTESLDDFVRRQLNLTNESWSIREEKKWHSEDENYPTSSNLPPRSPGPTVDPVPSSDPAPDSGLDRTALAASLSFPQSEPPTRIQPIDFKRVARQMLNPSVRPYVCPSCGKGYLVEQNLERHLRVCQTEAGGHSNPSERMNVGH